MSDASDISEALVNAVLAITRHFVTVEGTITATFPDKYTCNVDIDGATFFNVPLAAANATGSRAAFQEIPAVGAECLLCFRDGNLQRPQIFRLGAGQELQVNYPHVIFNEGTLGGLVKVIQLTEKINNIENLLNDTIAKYNSHVHPVISEGSPTGPVSAPEPGTIIPTQRGEIENLKITQ